MEDLQNNSATISAGAQKGEAPPTETEDAAVASRRILDLLLSEYSGPVTIRLWNGDVIKESTSTNCAIIFRNSAPIRDMVSQQSVLNLAEHFLVGNVDIEGDMEAVFDFVEYMITHAPTWKDILKAKKQAWQMPTDKGQGIFRNSSSVYTPKKNSKETIAHHYDVSNEFYRLWLDPEMVYSCAYFKEENQNLAEAQRDKLDHICRKLRLKPGLKLLDIGCGWGALVIWAARNYGVQAHGITLSERQYNYAVERVRSEGLEDLVNIELIDYRNLPKDAQYDRVVSVGMFEHIGVENYPVYFGTVSRVLKPNGLFLNHGISSRNEYTSSPYTQFINKYVFPDGQLSRISTATEAMEKEGLEIIDVEGLQRHYAITLRRWTEALEANKDQALEIVEDRVYRLWVIYMYGYAYYFERGDFTVYQTLVGHEHQTLPIPLRRDDLYRDKE